MAEHIQLDHNPDLSGVQAKDLAKADDVLYNEATKANRKLIIAHMVAQNAKTKEGAILLFKTIVKESGLAVNHPQYGARVAVIAASIVNWLKGHVLRDMPAGTQDISLLNDSTIHISLDAVSLLTQTEEKLSYFLNVIEDTVYAASTEANFLHIFPAFRIHMDIDKLIALRTKLIKESLAMDKINKIATLLGAEKFTADDAIAVNDFFTDIVNEYIHFNFITNSDDFTKNVEIIAAGKNILTVTDKKAMITLIGAEPDNCANIAFTSTSTVASQEPEFRRNIFFEIRQNLLSINSSKATESEKKANTTAMIGEINRAIITCPFSLFEMHQLLKTNSDLGYDIAGLTANSSNYVECKNANYIASAQRLLLVKPGANYTGMIGELRSNSVAALMNDPKFSSEDAITYALLFGKRMPLHPMKDSYIKGMVSRGVSEDFIHKILSNSMYVDLQSNFHINTKIMSMFKNSRDMVNTARASDVALMKKHSNSFAQRSEFRKWVEKLSHSNKLATISFIDSITPQKRLADSKLFSLSFLEAIKADGKMFSKLEEFFPSRTLSDVLISKRLTVYMLNNFEAVTTNEKQFKYNGGKLEFSVVGNFSEEMNINLAIQRESNLELIRKDARYDSAKTTWVSKDSINRPVTLFVENNTMGSINKDFTFKLADISVAFSELIDGNEYQGRFSTGFTDVKVSDMMTGSGAQAVQRVPDINLLKYSTSNEKHIINITNSVDVTSHIIHFNTFDQFESKYPDVERNGIKISNAKGFFKTLIDKTLQNFLNRQAVSILPMGIHEELRFKFRLRSPIDLLSVNYFKVVDLGFLTNKSIHSLVGLEAMNEFGFLYNYKSISVTEFLYRALTNSAKSVLYNLRNYPTLFRILNEDSLIDNRLVSMVKDGMKAFSTEMQPYSDEQKIVIMSIILPTIAKLVANFDTIWSGYQGSSTTAAKKKAYKEQILRTFPAAWNADAYVSENIPGLESVIGADASTIHLATDKNVADIIEGNTVHDITEIGHVEADLVDDIDDELVNKTTIIAPQKKDDSTDGNDDDNDKGGK